MDFDDLDDAETAQGPTPEIRGEELVAKAHPPELEFPAPRGKLYGKGGKMKMLFLHGGGVNQTVANMQIQNLFVGAPQLKDMCEWTVFQGPLKVPAGWNGDMSLKAFGSEMCVYFERLPFANCQWETWEGIDESVAKFKEFSKEHGAFDGAVGFDMGGEMLVHLAHLASQGDKDLKGAFRFLILFTTTAPKHLSPTGKLRPTTPLRIPAICSWANTDENHPYMEYEELPLFFDKDYREVIVHYDGHKPPRIVKDDQHGIHDRFATFLEAMRIGLGFKPSDHEDNKRVADLWLPMVRVPASPLPAAARKRLLVVPDPLGAHDLVKRAAALQQMKTKGELLEVEGKAFEFSGSPMKIVESAQLAARVHQVTAEDFKKVVGDSFAVEAIEYSKEQKEFNWHCKPEETGTRQVMAEDVINNEKHEMLARSWAGDLLAGFSRDDDEEVGIVGIGTGAYLALHMARVMVRERKYVPAGLWVVNPPTRLPWAATTKPGSLVDCPIKMLVHEWSTFGPGWRYEVQTCGPYDVAIYKDMGDMLGQVVEGFKAR